MKNAECKIEVSPSGMIEIVPQAHLPFACYILHFAFPDFGEGIKIIPSPDETGVGYKVFHGSTLVTA